MDLKEAAGAAKAASLRLAAVDTDVKNDALRAIAGALDRGREAIVRENAEDLERSRQENLSAPLLKRLKFDDAKIDDVVDGIDSLVELEEPVGRTMMVTELDQGLMLFKKSCPIGVIGVIFESRPDALIQIATLCLKSGNAVLLKGGSEARKTNRILADTIAAASEDAGIPAGWLQLLETREDVREMLKMDQEIDLVIPRGSNEFVRYIMENSNIPVLGHADGICHVYVDADADVEMAVEIAVDSKVQYVAVCNAMETLLVHKDIAAAFLPEVKKEFDEHSVELVGCPETRKIIDVAPATEEDWATEYLDKKLSIKVVGSAEEAVEHINKYGSGHTDAIVTGSTQTADFFLNYVDSANVFWNCSTRFSDGFRYGFGAEVGISTNKIHARGPVGLDGLLTYKYLLLGRGQVVDDYVTGVRSFTHRQL